MGCQQSGQYVLSYIPAPSVRPKPNLHTAITRRRRFGIIGIGITAVVMNIRLGVTILGPVSRLHLPPEEDDDPHQEGAAHNQRGSQCRQIPQHAGPFPSEFGALLSYLALSPIPATGWTRGLPSGRLDPPARRA